MKTTRTLYTYDDMGIYSNTIVQEISKSYLNYVQEYGEPADIGVLQPFSSVPNSTTLQPPIENGKIAVWNGSSWELANDYRNTPVFKYNYEEKRWVEFEGYIGKLGNNIRVIKPEDYETPDGIDPNKLKEFKLQELDTSYGLSKNLNFKKYSINLNQSNTQTINNAASALAMTRSFQPIVLYLTSGDVLIESSNELQQLQFQYNNKQVELYRQNSTQLDFLNKATLDELLAFKPSFGGENGK